MRINADWNTPITEDPNTGRPMMQRTPHQHNWTPGQPGKGFILDDGAVHTWDTDHMRPTHAQVVSAARKSLSEAAMQLPNYIPPPKPKSSSFFHIEPSGRLWQYGSNRTFDPDDRRAVMSMTGPHLWFGNPGDNPPVQADQFGHADSLMPRQADYYHRAPTEDRSRIRTWGLQPGSPQWSPHWYDGEPTGEHLRDQPTGVYMAERPRDTMGAQGQHDVWRIDPSKFDNSQLIEDPAIQRAWIHPQAIPPEALSLHRPDEYKGWDALDSDQEDREFHDQSMGMWDGVRGIEENPQWGIGRPDRVIGKLLPIEELAAFVGSTPVRVGHPKADTAPQQRLAMAITPHRLQEHMTEPQNPDDAYSGRPGENDVWRIDPSYMPENLRSDPLWNDARISPQAIPPEALSLHRPAEEAMWAQRQTRIGMELIDHSQGHQVPMRDGLDDFYNRQPIIYDPHQDQLHVGWQGALHPELLREMDSPGELAFGWLGANPDEQPTDAVYNRGKPNEVGWYNEPGSARPSYPAHQQAMQLAQQKIAREWAAITADNSMGDSRNFADPTEPRASKPPMQKGCTCVWGQKLECPIHGLNADPDADLNREWHLPEGSPIGYPQDQSRSYTDASP
jgi:hypothetical protein